MSIINKKMVGFVTCGSVAEYMDVFQNKLCLPTQKYDTKVIALDEDHENLLKGIVCCDQEEFTRIKNEFNQCDVIVGFSPMLAPWLSNNTQVKWVHSLSAGVKLIIDNINHFEKPKFVFTRSGGACGQPVAEYVIVHILAVERKFFHHYKNQNDCLWDNWPIRKVSSVYRTMSELSISVLGVGDIGLEVAKHCKKFNMTVYGMVSKIPEDKKDFVDEYFTSRDLNEYLKKSDFVCSILPKTPLTDNILSGGILKNCSERQSVLINVGRGNVINEESILEALEKKWIKGAVLDVFEPEPLRTNSPLWKHPDVIVTPHVSGVPSCDKAVKLFLENLSLFEEEKKLKFTVDFEKGY